MKSLFFALTVLFAHSAFAQGRACFFENPDYKGASFCLNANQAVMDLQTTQWAHRITSVFLEGPMVVKLWNKPGTEKAASVQLDVSTPNLTNTDAGNWNKIAMSISSWPTTGRVCLFEHPGYQGRYICMTPGGFVANLAERKWSLNDQISSIKLDANASVWIYEHAGMGGRKYWVQKSIDDVRSVGWERLISSFQVKTTGGF